jgi:hypothetical protein
MTELKTQKNDASVEAFLNRIEDEKKRQDSYTILELMKEVTGADPVMWGTSIIGFGTYHYKYASGREGDWMVAGFSPRKQNLTVYLTSGVAQHSELLEKLGKFTTGKGCLYIKKLEHVNQDVLRELVKHSVEHMAETNVLEE